MQNVPSEKVLGYVLLAIGIVILLLSLFNVYQLFSKQIEPVSLFAFDSISVDFGKALGLPQTAGTAVEQELLNSDVLTQPANFFTHVFIVGFFASIGFKIASIGAMLVRPIKVHLKEHIVKPSSDSPGN